MKKYIVGGIILLGFVCAGFLYFGLSLNKLAHPTSSQEDLAVKDILVKATDNRYGNFFVPAGVVVDPNNFTFAGYYMKTAGSFYKDSKYLYWVVFPESVYDQKFSITRVQDGDPATFRVLDTGSFDGSMYAADKNQFYCGPRAFPAINPTTAKVVVENGEQIVVSGNKKYHITAQLHELVQDPNKTCELVVSKHN